MVVAELLQWGAPAPFILLCVLLGFYPSALQMEDLNFGVSICRHVAAHPSPIPFQQDLDYIELFAGAAHASQCLRQEPHMICQFLHLMASVA